MMGADDRGGEVAWSRKENGCKGWWGQDEEGRWLGVERKMAVKGLASNPQD